MLMGKKSESKYLPQKLKERRENTSEETDQFI
jgi:hypothetical protein